MAPIEVQKQKTNYMFRGWGQGGWTTRRRRTPGDDWRDRTQPRGAGSPGPREANTPLSSSGASLVKPHPCTGSRGVALGITRLAASTEQRPVPGTQRALQGPQERRELTPRRLGPHCGGGKAAGTEPEQGPGKAKGPGQLQQTRTEVDRLPQCVREEQGVKSV